MAIKKKISIEYLVIIFLGGILAIMLFLYISPKLTTDQIIDISKTFFSSVLTIFILWWKGSYDKRKVAAENEEQHTALYSEIAVINEKSNKVAKEVALIKEDQIVMNEHLTHKSLIKSINVKIERKILKIIRKEIKLPNELQVLLIDAGMRVYNVLHDSLETGFDNFNMEYIQMKLIGQAKSLRNNINYKNLNVGKRSFDKRLKEDVIYPLISTYIRELGKLVKEKNGIRRALLEESTLAFIENLTTQSIQVCKDTQIKRKNKKTTKKVA